MGILVNYTPDVVCIWYHIKTIYKYDLKMRKKRGHKEGEHLSGRLIIALGFPPLKIQ